MWGRCHNNWIHRKWANTHEYTEHAQCCRKWLPIYNPISYGFFTTHSTTCYISFLHSFFRHPYNTFFNIQSSFFSPSNSFLQSILTFFTIIFTIVHGKLKYFLLHLHSEVLFYMDFQSNTNDEMGKIIGDYSKWKHCKCRDFSFSASDVEDKIRFNLLGNIKKYNKSHHPCPCYNNGYKTWHV